MIDLRPLSTSSLTAALADVERQALTPEVRQAPNNEIKRRVVDGGVALVGELWRRGWRVMPPLEPSVDAEVTP